VMFNEIWIFNMVGISLTDNIGTYGYFFLFTLIIGLFTGIGPAVFLSRLKTINTLKGSAINMSRRRRSLISSLFGKKTLISIQFSLSILMLVTILVIDKQADYLVNAHYGFNDTEVFYINGQGHDSDLLKQEFGSMAGVEKVTFASHHPAVGRSHGDEAYWDPEKEPITLYHFSVDPSYVDVMDLKVIAGRDFPEDMLTKNEKFVLINEKAVETLGFGSQSEAIGEIVIMDSLNFIVVGVLQDYHWEPLTNSIRPLALRVNTDKTEFIYLKVKSDNMIAERKKFQEAWTNFDPGRDFDGGLLSDKLDEFYQFFYDLGSILTYVALIALSITSLGFLGMVSFELKTKVKEIGIRKVLGATFQSLIMSMSKGFIVMIALTSFLAIPLGVWLNNLWVQKIAFHQPVDSSIVINTIIIVLIIAGVTIISQLWINANKNPTETLRSE
ncbi:MAG: ABC transporter permease, partial [Ekhidna sp.]|nr:ABC transporter permease [Ekhidna sp.]